MLTDKQRGVLRGMVAGLGVSALAIIAAIVAPPAALLPAPGLPEALAHALKWDALVLACLAVNIGVLARHRFFTPLDIDGGGVSRNTPQAGVLQATLQNTLEQAVLALGTHAAWAASMAADWQAAVPAAAVLFVAGRVLFWRGYARGAPARALGFALTFYPSIVMLLLVASSGFWGRH